jgi:glycosyltransferase involved in cell wall biosynthesis
MTAPRRSEVSSDTRVADPQRIAWVVYGSLEQISGGYIYDRLVIEHLRKMGDHVTCISLEPGGDARWLPATAEYDVMVGDELCFRELGPLFRAAPAALRRVLLIHHLSAWEQVTEGRHVELLALEKAAIESADVCVATSQVTAERLRRAGLSDDVRVAEPGADRLPRVDGAARAPHDARVRLLFIGNVLPRKAVLELVRTFARVASPQVELVLVGAESDGAYAVEVRAAIREAGAGRVSWMGSLDVMGVAEQLALADALVLPSLLEGYGMVLGEALWAGVPIIASRVGAAEQLVRQTGAGILFDPQDRAGFAATLRAFLADGALRARLRRSALSSRDSLPRWRDTARAVRATLRSP